MADLGKVRINVDLSTEGVWLPYIEDIELRIARNGNPRYEECVQRLVQNNPDLTRAESEVVDRAMAETVLLDWKNVQVNGEDIPYSVEKAYEFLSDPELRDFRSFVMVQSTTCKQFLKKTQEDAEKN
jgi:hypothetical protein